MNQLPKIQGILLVLLLVGQTLFLFPGLDWGLPDGTLPAHRSSNFPDENAILQDTLSVAKILQGDLAELTQHKFYMQEGWLGHYYRLGLLGAAYGIHYIHLDSFESRSVNGYDLINFKRIFLVSRLGSVLAALATTVVLYWIRKEHFPTKHPWDATLLFIILPGPILLSHFAKANSLATFFATSALYCALSWYQKRQLRWALLAGVLAGLAGGSRIEASLSIIPLGLAGLWLWRKQPTAKWLMGLIAGGAGFLLALAFSYPHMLLAFRLPDYGTGNLSQGGFQWAWVWQGLWVMVGGWAGIGLIAISLALGLIRSITRREATYGVLLVWALLYCLVVAKTASPQPRYLMPIMPTLALLAALGISWGIEQLQSRPLQYLAATAVVIVALPVFAMTIASVSQLAQGDPAVQAAHWVTNSAPEGTVIGKACWEGDHKTPIDPQKYQILYSSPHPEQPQLEVADHTTLTSPEYMPEYVMIFEHRTNCNRFDLNSYRLIKTFGKPLGIFGFELATHLPNSDPVGRPFYEIWFQQIYVYQKL
jgi:hypothetical protein